MNQQSNQVNLSVKDFQIVKNANLSFLPGLNCIIGQSNNGKSALMRAAKACIYNESGTTSVRTGCSNFAVGLQMNGHTVILQKGTNSLYKIDGEIFGKIGRTQLDEVANVLKLKELQINGTNETINFWDQMEKPFLLDRSETELFRFIVDSGKDNNVTTSLKSLTQDRQQITKDITITEGKIKQIEDTISRQEQELVNSDKKLEVYSKVIELGPKIKRVQEVTNLKNKSQQDGQLLMDALKQKARFDSLFTILDTKLQTIDLSKRKFEVLSNLIYKINFTNGSLDTLNKQLSKTKSIDISDLNENFSKYKLLSELISKSRDTQIAIQELSNKKYPKLSDDFAKKAQDLAALNTIIDNITYRKQLIEEETNKLNTIVTDLDKVNNEIKEIGICPTCGQPIHNN